MPGNQLYINQKIDFSAKKSKVRIFMKLLDTQTIASSTEININFNGLRSHNKGKGSFLDASGNNNYVRYDDKMAKEGNVPMDLLARIYTQYGL